jgi:hypothetical protein
MTSDTYTQALSPQASGAKQRVQQTQPEFYGSECNPNNSQASISKNRTYTDIAGRLLVGVITFSCRKHTHQRMPGKTLEEEASNRGPRRYKRRGPVSSSHLRR